MSRFAEKYKSEVAPALMTKFGYKSPMQVPRFNKIVINVGAGDARENSKVIDSVIDEISQIAGQKAVPTYARKSVANFKLREGMKIGVKVTLRGERMYEFMDKLFNFALPRVRDFKGINPNAFDG
jgi:large subunit ribosomal protein L5